MGDQGGLRASRWRAAWVAGWRARRRGGTCWPAGPTGGGWNQRGPTANPPTGAATATPAPLAPARTAEEPVRARGPDPAQAGRPGHLARGRRPFPAGRGTASAPVTASAQAADLIDRLQAADVTLIYDPATRALPARTGSPAWKTSPIWPPPKASSPRQRSRQRVNDLQALARRGKGQCRSRWRRAGPRAVRRCRAAAGVDHPAGGRQLRGIGDRTHPRAVPRGHPQRGGDLVSPPGNSRSGPLRVCPARRGSPSFRPHDHHRTAVRITTRMAIPGKDARPTQRAASGPA